MAYIHQETSLRIAQGEIEFFPVTADHFDKAELAPMDGDATHYILSHSESGHHHVLDRKVAEVHRVANDPLGMTVLRMLVTDPTARVVNLKPHGHRELPLRPGLYEARISREMTMDDLVRDSRD